MALRRALLMRATRANKLSVFVSNHHGEIRTSRAEAAADQVSIGEGLNIHNHAVTILPIRWS
jgi:hypothetical protein